MLRNIVVWSVVQVLWLVVITLVVEPGGPSSAFWGVVRAVVTLAPPIFITVLIHRITRPLTAADFGEHRLTASGFAYQGGDGSSFEAAVVWLPVVTNVPAAEWEWIEESTSLQPGDLVSQSLVEHEQAMFDVLEFDPSGADARNLYFRFF